MNLFDMARRKDDTLMFSQDVTLTKVKDHNGETWRSLRIQANHDPQISVLDVIAWYPFCTRPDTVGWYAKTVKGDAKVVIRFVSGSSVLGSAELAINENPRPVPIPWPILGRSIPAEASLSIHFILEQAQVGELVIHKALDRHELIDLASGYGVEIGPGPRPQIINSEKVHVQYVEEMSAGEWRDLYDKGGQYNSEEADWSHHIVGKAGNLPCEDASLDFIFSSHVFEHLTNPIGHLEHWASKLRPGGLVLAIVPDIAGTKDFRHQPSLLDELMQEYRDSVWEPTRRHYERWASTRGNWQNRVDEAMNEKRSIHAHFYTRENTAALLNHATKILPFSGFHIRHTPNHRDFYWVLVKR